MLSAVTPVTKLCHHHTEMPCIPPQHFSVSHHPSLGHCLEIFPFNIYHDINYKPNTGFFSFPGIQVARSPKKTVPVLCLALHSTISKTIIERTEWCRHSHLVVLLLHTVVGAGRGEQVAHKVLWKKVLLVVCPKHLLQKICSDSSCASLGNVT